MARIVSPQPSRRQILTGAAGVAAAAVVSSPTRAAIDGAQFGLRPSESEDQTRALRRALERAAGAPLTLPPGPYRIAGLALPSGARVDAPGARFLPAGAGPLMVAREAAEIALTGLTFDGTAARLADTALVDIAACRAVTIEACRFAAVPGDALHLTASQAALRASSFLDIAGAALHALDCEGLAVTGNTIQRAGRNGLEIWRGAAGHDGSLVADNRIEQIAARDGGSGQNGNAINVFRAGNVSVRGNAIRDCAFSAVRGNAASNLQIVANSATRIGEVALYAEFGFEGALIAQNIVDGAALGVVATNFNEGGRLATVQGNLIRNLAARRPAGTDPGDVAGVGIAVEADAAVTGNVVEGAPFAGILAGAGRWQRDIAITGNVLRRCAIGIGASVSSGAGAVLIADNLIVEAARGAILGMEGARPLPGELAADAQRYPHLTVANNRVR